VKRTASFFGFALTTLALVGCAAHRAVITDAQGRLSVDRLAVDIATLAQFDDYLKKTYHTPSDEYDDSWDLAGAGDALRVLFAVGYAISNQRRFPNWYKGDEFRHVREAAVKAARNQGNNSR